MLLTLQKDEQNLFQSVQSGHSDTSRITNGHTNGHSSHEYQVFIIRQIAKKHTFDMEHWNPVALNSIRFECDTRLPEYFLLLLSSYFRSERSPGDERLWSVPAGVEGDQHKASLIKSRPPGDWWRLIVISDLWLPKLAPPQIRQPTSWFTIQFSLSQQPFSTHDQWQRMINTAKDTSSHRP